MPQTRPKKTHHSQKRISTSLRRILDFCKRHKEPLLILLFAIIFLFPFWTNRAYISGHDTAYHTISIIGLSEKNWVDMFNPKIIGELASDFGYGSGIFYPQLAHIIPAILYKLVAPFGVSVFVVMRFTTLLILFLSGICMYWLVRKLQSSKRAALLSSILYMGATYHLSDIFIRDSQAESLIFLFLPIVALSLYYLYQEKLRPFLVLFVLGVTGMIMSHLVMTLWVAVGFGIFVLLNWRLFFTKKRIIYVFIGAALSLLITSPFLIPLLQNRAATDYIVFFGDKMTWWCDTTPVSLASLASPTISRNSIIWALNLVGIVFMIYVLSTNDKTRKNKLLQSLITLMIFVLTFMMLIDLKNLPTFVQMLQVPWRLNVILNFLFALSIGILFTQVKPNHLKVFWFNLIILCSIINASFVWEKIDIDTSMTEQTLTESMAIFGDYLPVKTYDNRTKILSQPNDKALIVDNSEAAILDSDFGLTNISFTISNTQNQTTTIELPRLYYLGYQIQAIYSDGSTEILPYSESKNGLIEFTVQQDCNIIIKYAGTKLQQATSVLALITIVGLTTWAVYPKLKPRNKRQHSPS